MSYTKTFYINNSIPKIITYNGKNVYSVYYNDTLVWETYQWVGWNNATWEDIYNLCKAKQSGALVAWPSDVKLGATKTTTLSTSVAGATSAEMTLIGIDIDGPGVLTFHTKYLLPTRIVFGDKPSNVGESQIDLWYITVIDGYRVVHNSNARQVCADFYNACDAKPYIKNLAKQYYDNNDDSKKTAITDIGAWLPSLAELGFDSVDEGACGDEFTSGVTTPYPYYVNNPSKIGKTTPAGTSGGYWTRSASTKEGYVFIASSGSSKNAFHYRAYPYDYYFAPAFAIG